MKEENFLSRWSRRKSAAKSGLVAPANVVPPQAASTAGPDRPTADVPAQAGAQVPAPLPPVESLTLESDFAPFMKSEVDPGLKRQALKALFRDSRFNVMDGLDVYIDDYSKPDPLPEGWLEKMTQVERLGHYQPAPQGDETAAETPAEAAENAPTQPVPEPSPSGSASDTSAPRESTPPARES